MRQNKEELEYTYIEDQKGLQKFKKDNTDIKWMGFDTEFVGENRYNTLLCLIQIQTKNGSYLFDTIKLKSINILLKMISDPDILVISHAGVNDYQILHSLYKTLPQNVFDTQIAAGFVGYRYPVSFQKLLKKELNVNISKSYTVTDWEKRPLGKKQIQYAINDIIHLKDLYEALSASLKEKKLTKWSNTEMKRLESTEYYVRDKFHEARQNKLMKNLTVRERIFLMRLYIWRDELAEEKNKTKEQVLPKRLMATIVKNIKSGKEALKDNRTISNRSIERNWDTFKELYDKKASKEESEVAQNIKFIDDVSDEMALTNEMLFLLVKQKCSEFGISQSLVLQKSNLAKAQFGDTTLDFMSGWRRTFLGDDFIKLLLKPGSMKMDLTGRKCIVNFNENVPESPSKTKNN